MTHIIGLCALAMLTIGWAYGLARLMAHYNKAWILIVGLYAPFILLLLIAKFFVR